jgi:hypothetical protein
MTTKWKKVLLGVALVLPLAAIGASQPLSIDSPSMNGFDGLVEPPACDEVALPGTSTSYGCCWFFHMGKWYCFPCS